MAADLPGHRLSRFSGAAYPSCDPPVRRALTKGNLVHGLESKLDMAYHGKTLKELADAPIDALSGISPAAADLIKQALGIKTIRQLGTNQYFLAAQAIARLAD